MTRALALVLLLAAAACETPPAAVAHAPADATSTTWRSVGSWSGSGNRQTESFDVTTGALRLVWKTSHETAPGAGRLRVSLHSAISGRPLQTPVTHSGVGDGTAYLEDDPRVSSLVIESEAIDWTVTLDEAVHR